MVSLECHSIVSLELPSRRGWIDRDRRKFFVRQPAARGTFDFRAQALNQFGWTFARIHRMAAQTGTITAVQCFTRCREKIRILARRLFRRASWPAKNSGSPHANVENAFEAGITIYQGAIHRVGR